MDCFNAHWWKEGMMVFIDPEKRIMLTVQQRKVPNPGDPDYPLVPDEAELIGFITTGNYNLADGKGFGIGSILLKKALESTVSLKCASQGVSSTQVKDQMRQKTLCIVRNVGESIGRLAKWECID
jgi:ribonuclease P/MRP protein subunit POP1